MTTRLQDAIGEGHGVKVINTLTGFKWIAAKLRRYEEQLRRAVGPGFDYEAADLPTRARLLQQHSTFYVFGTEESYGYLPNDYVRDKDGNSACLMFAELCAWVKARGLTVPEYLDELFLRYGFYVEGVINLYYEGASGNARIRRILESYRNRPPAAPRPRRCSRPAASTPGTARATCCTASTCASAAARPSGCSGATAWARAP